jgi:hypothetical protein
MRLRNLAAAGILAAAALSFGAGTANAADLNCSDFATQAEAQAVYNADPSDPNNLDRDKDGIACETLPGGGTTSEDDTVLGSRQVSTRPVGAVAPGDGSSSGNGSALPYVLGGVALAGASGTALAARRSARGAA